MVTVEYIDALLGSVALTNQDPRRLARNIDTSILVRVAATGRTRATKQPPWTPEEDEYLKANYGVRTDREIGDHLGRTAAAVHLRWKRDLGLVAPTKHPDYFTPHRLAPILGVDPHLTVWLFKSGMIASHNINIAGYGRAITRAKKIACLRWMTRPSSWIYFHPPSLPESEFSGLVQRAYQEWDNEWWPSIRIAEHFGISPNSVSPWFRKGYLPGIQSSNKGGRSNVGWSNWWARRSDVLAFNPRYGYGYDKLEWSTAYDVFIVEARSAGLSPSIIASLNKSGAHVIEGRLRGLQMKSRLQDFAALSSFQIHVNGDQILSNWREHQRRFPQLYKAIAAFYQYLQSDEEPTPKQIHLVKCWLRNLVAFYQLDPALSRTLSRKTGAERTREIYYEVLYRAGVCSLTSCDPNFKQPGG